MIEKYLRKPDPQNQIQLKKSNESTLCITWWKTIQKIERKTSNRQIGSEITPQVITKNSSNELNTLGCNGTLFSYPLSTNKNSPKANMTSQIGTSYLSARFKLTLINSSSVFL